MKHFLGTIEEQNGEYEYTHKVLVKARTISAATKKLDKIARRWYDNFSYKDIRISNGDNIYFFNGGEVATHWDSIREISKAHYEVLKNYMHY